MKNKLEDESVDTIMPFVEDMMRHLENKEDKECKINQHCVRMQGFFLGYAVSD